MKKIAKWITSPTDPKTSVVSFNRTFAPKKALKKATVCASAMGVYTFFLNGARVGKGVLAPGWTGYLNRVQYQTYDVTALLQAENRLSFGVGQGWAVGRLADKTHCYTDQISFIAWMDVTYADGTKETLAYLFNDFSNTFNINGYSTRYIWDVVHIDFGISAIVGLFTGAWDIINDTFINAAINFLRIKAYA